ncbi:uncharacterized protein LOC114378693 [Glycine soja]|uniref:uncharacterized protein LOC114378693 n=1 Tax=Glycine soja TaxID=3848 RepID=UPI0010406FE0|nr:uncharacterized protein LOC114378693 [Glycine soja]
MGLSAFQLVYRKTCHLPVELEHKAYWALRLLNFDEAAFRKKRKLQLLELEEIRMNAYESSKIYKLRLLPGKLKSKWSGTFVIKEVRPHGAMELVDPATGTLEKKWIVNGQHLKIYNGGQLERYQLTKPHIRLSGNKPVDGKCDELA